MKRSYRALSYLSYTIAFIVLVILFTYLERYFKNQVNRFSAEYIYINIIFLTLYPIVIGLFLGLPSLINKVKKNGVWKVNWLKLMVIGVPTLFFASLYIFLQPFGFGLPVISPILMYLLQPTVISANGILFGFTIINSFDKND